MCVCMCVCVLGGGGGVDGGKISNYITSNSVFKEIRFPLPPSPQPPPSPTVIFSVFLLL